MSELKPCPKCGAKAYILQDVVNGFSFGWSAGCPRYSIGDGIHGIDSLEDHEVKGYAVRCCATKEGAIKAWNRRADNER